MRRLFHLLALRGWCYLFTRPLGLLGTYGVTAHAMKRRVLACVRLLARYQCLPTLPTTSGVIEHHPGFCRELQSLGVELGVHGHKHVEYRRLPEKRATDDMAPATRSFERHRISFERYRCPYMSCKEDRPMPSRDGFRYSSNQTIWWDVVPPQALERATSPRNR